MNATIEIDMYKVISDLSDADRLKWIDALLATIDKAGTIDRIRAVVNSESYDD